MFHAKNQLIMHHRNTPVQHSFKRAARKICQNQDWFSPPSQWGKFTWHCQPKYFINWIIQTARKGNSEFSWAPLQSLAVPFGTMPIIRFPSRDFGILHATRKTYWQQDYQRFTVRVIRYPVALFLIIFTDETASPIAAKALVINASSM